MKNQFNNQLRSAVQASYRTGELQEISTCGGRRVPEESKKVLFNLVYLVTGTRYFKEDTKQYLLNKFDSYLKHVNRNEVAQNKFTSRSRIQYDLRKLKSAIGEEAMDEILKAERLAFYQDKLSALILKHENLNLLEQFYIKIPKDIPAVEELDDEDFKILEEILKYGSYKGKRLLEKTVRDKPELLGYISYLEKHADDSQDNMIRFGAVCEWLK